MEGEVTKKKKKNKKTLTCQVAQRKPMGNRESFGTFRFGNAESELNFRNFNSNVKNSMEALQCPSKR